MKIAIKDFVLTLTQFRRFCFLSALTDIKNQYRRSTLGPWWITLSMVLYVVILSVVYSRLMHEQLGEYVTYVGCGYAVWYLISTSISAGANVFNGEKDYITQINKTTGIINLIILIKV